MSTPVFSYQLSQLQSDLQTLLGDLQGTRFSSAQLTDAINYSIKDMCTTMGYSYVEALVPQNKSGTTAIGDQVVGIPPWVPFSLIGLYPDLVTTYSFVDYIEIKSILFGYGVNTYVNWPSPPPFVNASIPLTRTKLMQENIYNPNWRALASYSFPQRWDFFDNSRIVVFPFPVSQTGDIGYLNIGYIQQPALMASAADTVDRRIPQPVQPYIKYGAASWLLSLDQSDTTSLQTAKLYADTFTQLLSGKKATP